MYKLPRDCTPEDLDLDLIVRGDGVPVGGRTWVQLSIGLANFGRLSRMLPYLWTIGVGVVPENDVVALAWLWRVNVRWIQKILDEGTMNYCGTAYPTRVFFWGGLTMASPCIGHDNPLDGGEFVQFWHLARWNIGGI